jgi:hypothetical protein
LGWRRRGNSDEFLQDIEVIGGGAVGTRWGSEAVGHRLIRGWLTDSGQDRRGGDRVKEADGRGGDRVEEADGG